MRRAKARRELNRESSLDSFSVGAGRESYLQVRKRSPEKKSYLPHAIGFLFCGVAHLGFTWEFSR